MNVAPGEAQDGLFELPAQRTPAEVAAAISAAASAHEPMENVAVEEYDGMVEQEADKRPSTAIARAAVNQSYRPKKRWEIPLQQRAATHNRATRAREHLASLGLAPTRGH